MHTMFILYITAVKLPSNMSKTFGLFYDFFQIKKTSRHHLKKKTTHSKAQRIPPNISSSMENTFAPCGANGNDKICLLDKLGGKSKCPSEMQ